MGDTKRKEIYKYEAPWQTYSMNWSRKKEKRFRVAVGSFIEEYGNKVLILSLDEDEGDFREVRTFSHPYPTTKIVWIPDHKGVYPDLLATSGDYLRIWRIKENNEVVQECRLNTDLTSSFCAPITSFDWNEIDPNILTTCTIDTTCTIWSLETQQKIGEVPSAISATKKNQIVAHDKEVYDIAFSSGGNGKDIFATVGGDGSLRLFDLRNLLNSTILYEDRAKNPLLRVSWNKQDPNHIATFGLDSTEVLIFDIRQVNVPVAKLQNHKRFVNGISWAPHSSCHICTISDDSQALIWDIQSMPRSIDDPILAYSAGGEINQVQWSSEHLDWIAICYKNCLELLRV